MKDIIDWITKQVEFRKVMLQSGYDKDYCLGVIFGLSKTLEYVRDYKNNQCNHYWVKTIPLDEINQTYLCLNCDLLKKG